MISSSFNDGNDMNIVIEMNAHIDTNKIYFYKI